MKPNLALAGLMGLAVLMPGASHAEWPGLRPEPRRHALPPISGTIRVNVREFGRGHAGPSAPLPRVIYGSGTIANRYGPAYGDQALAFQQLAAANRATMRREVSWRGDGTGLVGALSGGADRYVAEAPVEVTYGEPVLWGRAPVPPTGGLGYYSSGAPSTMSYYGSSSSAGPYGSPGGLATYSSGSYGPGPHIIRVPRGRTAQSVITGGPKIVTRAQHGRYANW